MKSLTAWGKLNQQGNSHSLTAHMLDVAACFCAIARVDSVRRALARAAGRPLTEIDLMRLAALAFLHDVGKAKVPVLVINGFSIWDTLSIVEYLAEEYPEVWPSEKNNRAWARSACAEMHSSFFALRNECSMSVGVRVRLHEMSVALKSDIA